jgi:hypothetical protein
MAREVRKEGLLFWKKEAKNFLKLGHVGVAATGSNEQKRPL